MINFERIAFLSFLFLAGMLAIRMISLRKRGIEVSSKSMNAKKIPTYLAPAFIVLFFLWLIEIVKQSLQFSFSILPEPITNPLISSFLLQISGTVFIVFSLISMLITLVHFGTSLRFGLDENNRGKLITSGIFKRSRNPFFLSLDIYFVGIALLLPSAFFLFFALLAIVSIHFFILKEEVFMDKNYGEEYRKYRQKTRRYF